MELTKKSKEEEKVSLQNKFEALNLLSKDREEQDNYFNCQICYKVLL